MLEVRKTARPVCRVQTCLGKTKICLSEDSSLWLFLRRENENFLEYNLRRRCWVGEMIEIRRFRKRFSPEAQCNFFSGDLYALMGIWYE